MKKYNMLLYLFYCLLFVSSGYAASNMSYEDRLMKNYCDFNGMLKDKNRWIEEFRMLEEPRDHPNFEAMTDKLGVLMTLPKDIIKKCPRLKDYLTELVKYNANNEKIKKEISRAIEFISEKLSDDLVEYKEEL